MGAENEQVICSPDYCSAEKAVFKATLGAHCRVQGEVFQRTERKWPQQKHGRSSTPSLFGKSPQDEGRTQKQGQRKDKVFRLGSSGKTLDGGVCPRTIEEVRLT